MRVHRRLRVVRRFGALGTVLPLAALLMAMAWGCSEAPAMGPATAPPPATGSGVGGGGAAVGTPAAPRPVAPAGPGTGMPMAAPMPGTGSAGMLPSGGTPPVPPGMTPPGDTAPVAGMETPAASEADPTKPGPALMGTCPDGFTPKAGSNVMFPSMNSNIGAVEQRQFEVRLPEDLSTPRPVIVVLTGTEESTNASLDMRSGNGDGGRGLGMAWPEKGWIAVAPVRRCSRDANDGASASNCSVRGTEGFTWPPWNEGAARGSKWENEEGPDAVFMKEMVSCLAATWPVDQSRLFVTGVSSGGTFTHRLLTYQSDFWAGGMPQSGEWYVNMSLQNDPTAVVEGRCCPVPLRMVSNLFVISIWEGANDTWPGADYRSSAQAASNYFTSAMAQDVIQVSCNISGGGHHWQYVPGFNDWAEQLFYSHPKGATKGGSAAFTLPTPAPSGMGNTCEVGRYTTAFGR
jgi:hypothetical protein